MQTSPAFDGPCSSLWPLGGTITKASFQLKGPVRARPLACDAVTGWPSPHGPAFLPTAGQRSHLELPRLCGVNLPSPGCALQCCPRLHIFFPHSNCRIIFLVSFLTMLKAVQHSRSSLANYFLNNAFGYLPVIDTGKLQPYLFNIFLSTVMCISLSIVTEKCLWNPRLWV